MSVIVADCAEAMRSQIDAESVDLIVTSPPYDDLRSYKGYRFDAEEVGKGMLRVLKDGGVAVWVVGDQIVDGNKTLTSFRQALAFQAMGFNIHDVMIYHKLGSLFPRTNAYTPSFEFMLVLSKGKPTTFNPLKRKYHDKRQRKLRGRRNKKSGEIETWTSTPKTGECKLDNLWVYDTGFNKSTTDAFAFKHPAIFPERLAADHILSWSNPGDLVLDPMCGAGTTLKMARKLGRRYLGIEISPEYAAIARKRLAQADIFGDAP